MNAHGTPSRKSIEARLKDLAREARRLGIKADLPARLPTDNAGIDRLACKLLSLHRRHKSKPAFELAFDTAAPMVAEMVRDFLRQTFADVHAEEILAQVFLELSRPEVELPAEDGHELRRCVAALLPRLVAAADQCEHPIERRLPPPLHIVTQELPEAPADTTAAARPSSQINDIIAQNFLTLPELTQRCFYLHLVEGKSLPDVAQELGLSLASVSRRMREARLRALTMLEESRAGNDAAPDDEDAPHEEPSEGGRP